MKEFNINYILPLKHLLEVDGENEVINKLYGYLYSALCSNAYFTNDIKIYTDFKGMSLMSVLPFNFELIHSNNINQFKDKVFKLQKKPFILNGPGIYFKSYYNFDNYLIDRNTKGNFILKNGLVLGGDPDNFNESTMSNVNIVEDIFSDFDYAEAKNRLNGVSDYLLDLFEGRINKHIKRG